MTTTGTVLLAFTGLLMTLKLTLLSVAIVRSVRSVFERRGLLFLGPTSSPRTASRTRGARA